MSRVSPPRPPGSVGPSSDDDAAAWPPPPHDPRDRVLVTTAGAWQVRVFADSDPKLEYFVRRGLHHLQLWHPEAGVSVLSPSGLTIGQYETFPIAGWKRQARTRDDLVALLRAHHRLELPSAGTMAALEAWFVDDEALRRLGQAPAPMTQELRT